MKYLTNSLEKILIKHKDIEKNLMHQDKLDNATIVKLNKEYAELSPLIEKISDYRKCEKNINNLKDLQNDNDELIRDEAEKELKKENYQLKTLETDLFKLLIPNPVAAASSVPTPALTLNVVIPTISVTLKLPL